MAPLFFSTEHFTGFDAHAQNTPVCQATSFPNAVSKFFQINNFLLFIIILNYVYSRILAMWSIKYMLNY